MRFLHTSDWHLGRGFHGASLRAEQEAMVETLCRTVDDEQVDVVLVSGDVYDRALPPEWAVDLLERCLGRLAGMGVQVVITSGNHDSARRLGFGRGLMAASGVHIRSALEEAWEPVEFRDGDTTVLVYGIPYLEPQLYAGVLQLDVAHHTAVITEVTRRIRQDVQQRQTASSGPVVTMVMAHVFAAAGRGSDSERHIGAAADTGEPAEHSEDTLGGLSVVPLEVFEGFEYTALGHLHGRQRLNHRVRYSGSPLRFSFSEEAQAKGAWVIDTHQLDDPESGVTAVDWRIGRPVRRLRGTLAELLDPDLVSEHRDSFVQLTVTDPQRPARAYATVQEQYHYVMAYAYAGAARTEDRSSYAHRVDGARSTTEVVDGFLQHVRQRAMDPAEQKLIEQAMAGIRAEQAGDAE